MHATPGKRILLWLFLLTLCLGIAPVPQPAADRVRQDPLRAHFRLLGPALPGRPLEVAFTADPLVDLPDSTLTFLLPEGMTLVAGAAKWQGDLHAGLSQELRLSLLAPAEGEWALRVVVDSPAFRGVYTAYLVLSSDAGVLRDQPAPRDYPALQSARRLQERPRPLGLSAGEGEAVVIGRQHYQTRYGEVYPLAGADVHLYSGEQYLASTQTDDAGYYTFTVTLAAPRDVFAEVYCRSDAALVVGPSGSIYRFRTPTLTVAPGQVADLGSWQTDYGDDNWEALATATEAYRWVAAHTDGWTRSRVTIYWPMGCQGDTSKMTPCCAGSTIYLPQYHLRPWDRSTVRHEYAHSVMHALYGYFPMGCYYSPHYIYTESCEGFAMTEGWAEFLDAAIAGDPAAVSAYTCGALRDIESNNWHIGRDCTPGNSGAIVEGAVASILWDIYDDHNHPDGDPDRDFLALGFDEIWTVMSMDRPQSITAFREAWHRRYFYHNELALIFEDHGVGSGCPGDDAGDDAATATPLTPPVEHVEYLCPSGEQDWYRFPVQAGQRISAGLTSLPADYDLSLYRPDGSLAGSSFKGGTQDETIEHIAEADGEWRLQVHGYDGAHSPIWPYRLTISVSDSPPPDLMPQGPPDLELPLVATAVQGVRRLGPLYAGRPAYLSWRVGNGGGTDVDGPFCVELWVDELDSVRWQMGSLAPGQTDGVDDWQYLVDSPGPHTLRLLVDPDNAVAEADETNNSFTLNGVWLPVTGWWGEYFDNETLSGTPVLVRDDPDLAFDWGLGPPAPELPADHFSARWTRSLSLNAGRYRFHLRGDDGARLWIDGDLALDAWSDAGFVYTLERDLAAGTHELRCELREETGTAALALWWEVVEYRVALPFAAK